MAVKVGPRLRLSLAPFAVAVALGAMASSAAASADDLSTVNFTPFPTSSVISGAGWRTGRYGPPANQFGDILSTSSTDKDSLYVLIDDGGTDTEQPARWRNSFAHVTGTPGNLTFTPVGEAGPAKTYAEVHADEDLLTGPLGSYYANGFTTVRGVFYATQVRNWDWNDNAPFNGLAGIAYSTDQGEHWQSPKQPFPGPTGNLNFIQYGTDAAATDGYVYAIATEREFNASTLLLGRARADTADITNPARWQWAAGSATRAGSNTTTWTSLITGARPVLSWTDHITYPRMSYDRALGRYLLTFTYSYTDSTPGIWKDGSEMVILESPTPEGPFSFVAAQQFFGPSNGYDPAFPVNWMSADGTDLWMIWAANFDGCTTSLDCSGAYGFNYRQLRLTLRGSRTRAAAPALEKHRRRVPRHRHAPNLYITPPQSSRPRWIAEDVEHI